jgi:hypothetical protein
MELKIGRATNVVIITSLAGALTHIIALKSVQQKYSITTSLSPAI